MIPVRLPWRPRARPSATLHEIPACSIKSKLGIRYYYRPSGLSRATSFPPPRQSFWNSCTPSLLGNSLERAFGRDTYRFKPAADVDLGVGFATEMAGAWAHCGGQVPFDDGEILISTFDHEPADRILTDRPANLALKFLQTRHAFSR